MASPALTDERRALLALLDYYGALGVDVALEATPLDRYAESARPPSAASPVSSRPPAEPKRAPPTPLSPKEATEAAGSLAASARSLDELSAALAEFDGGGAIAKARRFLFSCGAPSALMVLDYAPGETEESSGEAFCGSEARLLAAMLSAIGKSVDEVYRAYFSPWRPPGGQTLSAHASAALAPFARRHVELARPKALLLLGDSAKFLLPTSAAPASLYARRFDMTFAEAEVCVVAAPSLAAMLNVPSLKSRAWRALRLIAEALSD
ncbi:MAG TPA: uracil-DNA glycosylase family protein [Methylocystis sp.]|nr:uracil-DNA glycosylase family protein [Methylocystis sp.]